MISSATSPCWLSASHFAGAVNISAVSLEQLMQLRDPADFPLPLLAPVLARTARELQTGRGFFLLRGLPVEKWSRQQVRCWRLQLGERSHCSMKLSQQHFCALFVLF